MISSERSVGKDKTGGPGRLWAVLLGIWAVAVGFRCIYLWHIHGAAFLELRIGDGEAYHLWARKIADGDWLGEGVFYQAPLYPYFLAIVYRVLGDGIGTVRLIQALMGGISCALLAFAGASLFGRRGALAGVLLAIYPPAIFLDGSVEKSALATLLVTALLALLAGTQARARPAFGAGVVLGLLALTRENALVLALPVLLWIGCGPFTGPRRSQAKTALVFVTGCALVLLPAALRNLAAGGEFHLTTAQFGPNFYIGNHAGADGTYQALVVGHGSAADEREDATRLAEQAAGRALSPGQVSRYWTQRAVEYLRAQPLAWLKLMARKLALIFNAAEVSDTESQDIYVEYSWLLRILRPFDFGLLFGMAAMGAVLTAASWRRLWLLYALVGTYALSVALFYVLARYRFPIVPVLMLVATGGVLQVLARPRLRATRTLGAAAAVGVAIAFAHLPLDNPRAARATHYFDIASALAKDPARLEDARGFYQRALDADPQFPPAQFGLGTLLARTGRPEEAIPRYRAAVKSRPDYAEARYNLGLALVETGQAQEAAQEYAEALRIRPHDIDARVALGKALMMLNRPGLALEQYETVLTSQPGNVQALVGSGVALAQSGRPEQAIEKYRLALEIDPQNAAAHNNLGTTLGNRGRIAEAMPHFERAVALNPGDENARRNLDAARQALSRQR